MTLKNVFIVREAIQQLDLDSAFKRWASWCTRLLDKQFNLTPEEGWTGHEDELLKFFESLKSRLFREAEQGNDWTTNFATLTEIVADWWANEGSNQENWRLSEVPDGTTGMLIKEIAKALGLDVPKFNNPNLN